MYWRSIALCAVVMLSSACGHEPRNVTIRGDDAAPLPSAAHPLPTANVGCLKTAASATLFASVSHGTGYYPTYKSWSLEWSPSGMTFTKNGEPTLLEAAAAQHLVSDVVSLVEDKSKDEGSYKTVTASLRWRCDDGPEGHARYSAIEWAPAAPRRTHVERVEHAFDSAAP